jgi:hypothetical protein
MGVRRGVYRVLMGRLEGKRPFGLLRRRWNYNIKMDLQEVGWEGTWAGLIWLRTAARDGLLRMQ